LASEDEVVNRFGGANRPGRRAVFKQRSPNISKEVLYENALASKMEANKLRDENRRLATKI